MTYPLKLIDVAKLKPYERNSRTHSDKQIEQLVKLIRMAGFTAPILYDFEADHIIAGHGRVMAAQRMIEAGEAIPAPGRKGNLPAGKLPVVDGTGMSEAERRAFVIAENQVTLQAGWDTEILAAELDQLRTDAFDLELLAFDTAELNGLLPDQQGQTDPDEIPEVPERPVSKLGDVWLLGPHRVACGDSTIVADAERAMAGLMADACWTDPPYNVNYESKLAGKIQNDSMDDDRFQAFLLESFSSAFSVMRPGAAIYVAHADTEGLNFRNSFKAAGFKLSGCLIWAKDSLVLGRSDYQWQHEPILYGWKPGASHQWFGGRKKTTLLNAARSVFSENADGTITVSVGSEMLIISGNNLRAEAVKPTILRCEKPKRSADHPTMKPVELIKNMLRNSTKRGDIVLDIFGGSGSTLIACDMMGRQARLIELEPKFVDVIVHRWQDFTGKEATLEETGQTFAEVAKEREAAA